MNYVIRWKSKVNGRAGKGSKEFNHDEAERLVAELNSEYPDIEHEAVEAPQSGAQLEEPHSESPLRPEQHAHVVSSE